MRYFVTDNSTAASNTSWLHQPDWANHWPNAWAPNLNGNAWEPNLPSPNPYQLLEPTNLGLAPPHVPARERELEQEVERLEKALMEEMEKHKEPEPEPAKDLTDAVLEAMD